MEVRVKTQRSEATFDLGVQIGTALGPGDVVDINGPLGAGKTVLAKGLALGIADVPSREVTSPAYTLIQEYRIEGRTPIFHMDFYRLEYLDPCDIEMIEEYLADPGAIKMIEWGNRFRERESSVDLEICIDYGEDGDESRLVLVSDRNATERLSALLDAIQTQ